MTPCETASGVVPGLVGFFADVYDRHGRFAGWEPVAWGLRPWPGRGVVTISAQGPPMVTWWRSFDTAETDLNAVTGVVRDGTVHVTVARLLGIDVGGSADGPLLVPRAHELTERTIGPPVGHGRAAAEPVDQQRAHGGTSRCRRAGSWVGAMTAVSDKEDDAQRR